MELTLTLKEIAIMAISISIVVFFAYCTALVKNLIITVKRTNYILEDSMKVSKIVADRSEDVNNSISKVISKVVDTIGNSKTEEAPQTSQNIKEDKKL